MRNNIISISAIAVVFLAMSCQKDNNQEPLASKYGDLQFIAGIEGCASTKTTVERITRPSAAEYKTKWENTDYIRINNSIYLVTPYSADSTKATLTKTSGDIPSAPFYAYFPASIYDGTTATLPASYTYEAGKYNMPMYVESSNAVLKFKGLCAVLAVKVTSSDIATLKTIKVKSNKAMCGTFSVSDGKAVLSNASDATKTVAINFSEALDPGTAGTTFYIAIPAQAYSYIEILLSSDGTTFTQMMCTRKASGLGTLACNTVYPVDYEANAVQLWSGGPLWSTVNIGANKSTDIGRYFLWGDVNGQTWNGSSWSGDGFENPTYKSGCCRDYPELTTEHDAATQKWGTGWYMPTDTDFENLINTTNTEIEYFTSGSLGIKIKGKGIFASNSIFLPSAGYGRGVSLNYSDSWGYYWSRTSASIPSPYEYTAYAYHLHIQLNASYVCNGSESKFTGMPIRPIRSL